MSSMYLSASTLSADAFSQYGEVVENRGDTAKRPLSTPFGSARQGVTLGFTVNRLHRQPLDGIRVRTLERHPHSAQTFIPLVPSRHVVVVGLSGPAPWRCRRCGPSSPTAARACRTGPASGTMPSPPSTRIRRSP